MSTISRCCLAAARAFCSFSAESRDTLLGIFLLRDLVGGIEAQVFYPDDVLLAEFVAQRAVTSLCEAGDPLAAAATVTTADVRVALVALRLTLKFRDAREALRRELIDFAVEGGLFWI